MDSQDDLMSFRGSVSAEREASLSDWDSCNSCEYPILGDDPLVSLSSLSLLPAESQKTRQLNRVAELTAQLRAKLERLACTLSPSDIHSNNQPLKMEYKNEDFFPEYYSPAPSPPAYNKHYESGPLTYEVVESGRVSGGPIRRGRPMKASKPASKMAKYAKDYRETKKKEFSECQQERDELKRQNERLKWELEKSCDREKRLQEELNEIKHIMHRDSELTTLLKKLTKDAQINQKKVDKTIEQQEDAIDSTSQYAAIASAIEVEGRNSPLASIPYDTFEDYRFSNPGFELNDYLFKQSQ